MNERIIKLKVTNKIPPATCSTVVYKTNKIIELTIIEKSTQKLLNCKRISKTEYVDTSTGEIKKYKEHNCSFKNINKSFTKLKRLINNNFVGNKNEIHITLTYSKPTYDKKQLSLDFKNFWKKLKYRYTNLEYICIYEKHKSGAWHIHCLVKDITEESLYIPYDLIKELWQQGNIHVNKIRNNNNIGAYFCKYAKENNNTPMTEYPKNGKLYSCSRGIQQPEKMVMKYSDAKKLTKDKLLTSSATIDIVQTDGVTSKNVNRIHYKQYNSKKH